MTKISDYQTIIGDKLKDLDIGLLILNAGWAEGGPFEWCSNQIIEDHITINVLHEVYTTKVLCSQMVKRYDDTGLKSGMIFVSSGLGCQPVAGMITYSAAKCFMSFLA